MSGGLGEFSGLALQRARGGGRLHHQFGVLLHHLIELQHRVVNLLNAFHLLAGSDGDFTHDAGNVADAADNLLHRFTREAHVARAGRDALRR